MRKQGCVSILLLENRHRHFLHHPFAAPFGEEIPPAITFGHGAACLLEFTRQSLPIRPLKRETWLRRCVTIMYKVGHRVGVLAAFERLFTALKSANVLKLLIYCSPSTPAIWQDKPLILLVWDTLVFRSGTHDVLTPSLSQGEAARLLPSSCDSLF